MYFDLVFFALAGVGLGWLVFKWGQKAPLSMMPQISALVLGAVGFAFLGAAIMGATVVSYGQLVVPLVMHIWVSRGCVMGVSFVVAFISICIFSRD